MSSIYLDPTALVLPSAAPGGGEDHVVPGAAEAVVHLVEAGFDVVVLGDTPELIHSLNVAVRRTAALPEHLDADAWYLTGEPYPAFGRPRGGTTVLIGPRRPIGKLPLPRFDLEARDLPSAVMEILTRQAMA